MPSTRGVPPVRPAPDRVVDPPFSGAGRTGGPYLGRIEATVHDEERWAEVAYVFGQPRRGQGHAREAVRWLLEQLEVDEVWACTTRGNTRSRRLLEALGFREAPSTRPLA